MTVYPTTIETARWASHDTRIDSILMMPENIKIFDKRQASIMKHYAKPLEIPLPPLLYSDAESRGMIYRRLNLFVRNKIALLVGSMSVDWIDLVSPISIVKFLSTQYDIPEKVALLALTDIPRKILSSKQVFRNASA